MKHLFKLLPLIFILITSISCSKDDDKPEDGGEKINRPELMYAWQLVEIENDGGMVSARKEYEYSFSQNGQGYYNMSYYINDMGSRTPNITFTYTLEGNLLTITYPNAKPVEKHNISFSSDKKTLILNSGSYKRL